MSRDRSQRVQQEEKEGRENNMDIGSIGRRWAKLINSGPFVLL